MINKKDYIIDIAFGHHSSFISEAENWCKAMNIDYYNGMPNPMYFSFKTEDDALVFKLTWG